MATSWTVVRVLRRRRAEAGDERDADGVAAQYIIEGRLRRVEVGRPRAEPVRLD